MNGQHERQYRGYRIIITLSRREHEMVHLRATTSEPGSNLPGPEMEYTEKCGPELLVDALQRIKVAIDARLPAKSPSPLSISREM